MPKHTTILNTVCNGHRFTTVYTVRNLIDAEQRRTTLQIDKATIHLDQDALTPVQNFPILPTLVQDVPVVTLAPLIRPGRDPYLLYVSPRLVSKIQFETLAACLRQNPALLDSTFAADRRTNIQIAQVIYAEQQALTLHYTAPDKSELFVRPNGTVEQRLQAGVPYDVDSRVALPDRKITFWVHGGSQTIQALPGTFRNREGQPLPAIFKTALAPMVVRYQRSPTDYFELVRGYYIVTALMKEKLFANEYFDSTGAAEVVNESALQILRTYRSTTGETFDQTHRVVVKNP